MGLCPCSHNAAPSLTRIANKPKPYVGRFAPIRRTNPQKHKTRLEGGVGVPTGGELSVLATPIFPENLNRCKPFFGQRGGLSQSSPVFRPGFLDPNGEPMSFAATLPRYLRKRREKLFGDGRPRPMDRNAKARIMNLARCLSRRLVKGKAYGAITAKALSVLEALLWSFHNAKSGLCFPSYEKIAEAAGAARSTVAEA